MVMRPQILHRQLWNQNYDFQLFLHVVSHDLKLKLWHVWFFLNFPNAHIHILHSLEVKILIFMSFFHGFQGFWSNTTLFSSCCWHRYAVFSCVFHVFGFQFTDHPFGQLENVFRVWSLVAKNEENIINHTCMELSGTTKCDIHVRSEFSILRHKKHNLLLYNVVLRGWQLRMHTYTNKVRIQHKPGSLPVAAHWFFQMHLFWK